MRNVAGVGQVQSFTSVRLRAAYQSGLAAPPGAGQHALFVDDDSATVLMVDGPVLAVLEQHRGGD